ncbi:MAG: hypothetical protein U0269_12435 [Polyangiales bacterium]
MRPRVVLAALASTSLLIALGSAATAQRRNPRGATATADGGASADASAASVRDSAAPATDAARAADAAASSMDASAPVSNAAPTAFDLPMNQRGNGALVHYPILEQLARNDVPVFAQVRSSAPIDHVSMFFRSAGATRYRELRMSSMGHDLGLPGGYGSQIPCEDAFPPAIEYYVNVVDTSGEVIGHAGTATQPVRIPIVTARTRNIVPTLPGQPPPRNCGSITGMSTQPQVRDSGVEERGTADLGEPCARDNDCRRGLRCGSARSCVFVSAPR